MIPASMSAAPRHRLFRQAALDRLSVSEALDTLMTVTGPRSWIALAAIGLLLAAALAWAIGGRLRVDVAADGRCVRQGADPLEAVLFAGARDARQLAVGATALVLPEIYDQAEYGSMTGTVASVGAAVASRDEIRAVLGEQMPAAPGPLVAVRVRLTPAPGTPSGVRWSSSSGPDTAIPSGIACTANVVVAERRPITLVVPALQRVFGS